MKYRAVFQPKNKRPNRNEVVSIYPNDSNVITTTGQKFMVDDLESLLWKLSANGVDISMFWVQGIVDRIEPFRTEIDISACPLDASVNRKVFVHETNTRYSTQQTYFNLVVRHYQNGVYKNPSLDPSFEFDDIFVNCVLDNTETVEDSQGVLQGEWDYMWYLVRNGIETQPYLEDAQIAVLDSNGVFNEEIYN